MTHTIDRAMWYVAAFLAAIALILWASQMEKAQGGAPSGLYSTISTTSQVTVGGTSRTIMATSTNCASRIISTKASAIMLAFTDDNIGGASGVPFTPSAVIGHLQAASSTVVYDGALYGCNAIKAYGYIESDLTVSETR